MGDHLGSGVVAARLVRDLMRLALLMARRYAPYTKWLGTAFARLGHEDGLDQALQQVLAAKDLTGREQALKTAYELVARRHNALGITEPVDKSVRDRPVRREHGRAQQPLDLPATDNDLREIECAE